MNAAPKLVPIHDAARLLDLLAPGEPVTFQTFGEGAAKSHRGLSRVLHGTLAEYADTLGSLNARGAGIFWMVNAGDGKGRKASNVQRVRALFVDLDGAPLEPVLASPLPPHAIIESSPGRWHAYWKIADCPVADFGMLQKALAERFNADATVHDLPRVLRLPGFLHRKGEPFLARIVELGEAPKYTHAEFVLAFGIDCASKQAPSAHAKVTRLPTAHNRRTLPDVIPAGERNTQLLSLAAGFVRRGYGPQQVNDRLQRINAERCQPPLGADEVDEIVTRACSYGSEGFAMLPHSLLDSRELKALPLPARWIIVTAFRRHDGTGAGVALTQADCQDIPGCADPKGFARYRALAVASGILECKHRGGMTRNGRAPNLYTISGAFMQSHRGQIPPKAHRGQIPPFYIDKQEERALGTGSEQAGERPLGANKRGSSHEA